MKKITVEVLKNINSYVIDKYYNEIYNLSNTHYEGTDKFLILQDILKHVSEIDKYVEVPISSIEWICNFVEYNQDYDKLTSYGDFYYKLKTLLRTK